MLPLAQVSTLKAYTWIRARLSALERRSRPARNIGFESTLIRVEMHSAAASVFQLHKGDLKRQHCHGGRG
ncbi:hypothetical protein ColTof4_11508 [Colletotrichum tofieldiae]|nr:hypothetical protein ColTof4_11508 [Colletotrichum tofieldiae]